MEFAVISARRLYGQFAVATDALSQLTTSMAGNALPISQMVTGATSLRFRADGLGAFDADRLGFTLGAVLRHVPPDVLLAVLKPQPQRELLRSRMAGQVNPPHMGQ